MKCQLGQRHQLTDHAGRRQHHQQKSKALESPQQQQIGRVLCPHAAHAGDGENQLAGDDAAPPSDAVRGDADQHANRHPGQLHHRQQEAGLDQRHPQGLAQYRNRRRHLADMQGRDHPGQDDDERRCDTNEFHESCLIYPARLNSGNPKAGGCVPVCEGRTLLDVIP
jgi:hypothetical protein